MRLSCDVMVFSLWLYDIFLGFCGTVLRLYLLVVYF